MGNSNNPIRNLDKRTARREYRAQFASAVAEYRFQRQQEQVRVHSCVDLNWSTDTNRSVRVLVRKRPIHRHELDGGEFDVVTSLATASSTANTSSSSELAQTEKKSIAVHDCRMHADMKKMLMTNHVFAFDGIFDEHASNEQVYTLATKPLVAEAVLKAGFATVCVYGQTGSGKTYTMSSFYEKAAVDVFGMLDEDTDRFAVPRRVSMSFIELHGDTCCDLLNAYETCQLMTAADGNVLPFPVVEPTVTCADELIALVRHALSIRTSAATGVHDNSSRSHSILTIYIQGKAGGGVGAGVGNEDSDDREEGVLTLVDLAGSEMNIDSMYHSADRRKEGAAINTSLMALKECIRARAENSTLGFHYRKSKLTMALKRAFFSPLSKTLILATVSPSSKDTEHSLNTLKHASLMNVGMDTASCTPAAANGEAMASSSSSSSVVQVGEVNVSELARANHALKKKGANAAQPLTSNGNTFGTEASRAKDREQTEKEKARERRQAERRAMAALDPAAKEILEHHRLTLGQEEQQRRRLSRRPSQVLADKAKSEVESTTPSNGGSSSIKRYYGLGVSNDDESSARVTSSARTVPSSSSPSINTASTSLSSRAPFQRLYNSVYSQDSMEHTPAPILRRQLVTLMKMHGYSKEEIENCAPAVAAGGGGESEEQGAGVNGSLLPLSPPLSSKMQRQAAPQPPSSSDSGFAAAAEQLAQEAAVKEQRRQAAKALREQREGRGQSTTPTSSSASRPSQHSPRQSPANMALTAAAAALAKETALKEARREAAKAAVAAKQFQQQQQQQGRTHASESSSSTVALVAAQEKLAQESQAREARREAAKAAVVAKQEQMRQALLSKKGFSSSLARSSSSSCIDDNDDHKSNNNEGILSLTSPMDDPRDAEMARITRELEVGELSNATRFGLTKQLNVLNAAKMREARKREKEREEREKQQAEEQEAAMAALAQAPHSSAQQLRVIVSSAVASVKEVAGAQEGQAAVVRKRNRIRAEMKKVAALLDRQEMVEEEEQKGFVF